jgi:hypothetical protein
MPRSIGWTSAVVASRDAESTLGTISGSQNLLSERSLFSHGKVTGMLGHDVDLPCNSMYNHLYCLEE